MMDIPWELIDEKYRYYAGDCFYSQEPRWDDNGFEVEDGLIAYQIIKDLPYSSEVIKRPAQKVFIIVWSGVKVAKSGEPQALKLLCSNSHLQKALKSMEIGEWRSRDGVVVVRLE